MATGYTREWIQFFTGCGIPNDVATMYALIFYENRIQKNMLLDLNKEYLRDMGITVMGDVIAILRYAKVVHEKYIREQILLEEDNLSAETNITKESSPSGKKGTPVKRMLEHYIRRNNSSNEELIGEMQVILPNEKAVAYSKTVSEKDGLQPPLKKKIEVPKKSLVIKEKGLEVPVPKVRRVLPENEGGYKIKMPLGNTERSKKLLEQAKKRKTKTVFERLGESFVSSTTSEISTTSPTNSTKSVSVFSRLGEKTAVSSTSVDEVDSATSNQLPYAGILKTSGQKKNIVKSTMRADEQQKSQVTKLGLNKGVSVKKRLGLKNKQNQMIDSSSRTLIETARMQELKKGQQTNGKMLRLTSKPTTSTLTPKKPVEVVTKNFNKAETISRPVKPPVVSTTTQVRTTEVRNLKRNLDVNEASSNVPSKKVRFGKTTHRLIPPTPGSSEPTNYVNNYPKLTMIINNRSTENANLPIGVKGGSLNSDKISQRVGIKDRIGNKSIQDRLGKRIGLPMSGGPPNKKITRIRDRLG